MPQKLVLLDIEEHPTKIGHASDQVDLEKKKGRSCSPTVQLPTSASLGVG